MTKVIADISGNHGGSLEKALDLIRAAGDCGCDYAKFQYYRPILMPDYEENRDDYQRLAIPRGWLTPLFDRAARSRIPLFASVFHVTGVREIDEYGPLYFKIASPESTRLADYGKIIGQIRRGTPIIFSTGDADYQQVIKLMGRNDILLYCPPGHPTPPLDLVAWVYDGLSDHCADLTNARWAIHRHRPVGWIERHIKLDDDCIDAAFSSNPKEMAELCRLAHA